MVRAHRTEEARMLTILDLKTELAKLTLSTHADRGRSVGQYRGEVALRREAHPSGS